MNGRIHVSVPYTRPVESDIFGPAARLCAEVTMTNPNSGVHETRECYFEFEERYGKYLCPERSDAFVAALLFTGLENSYDIEFETPLTERLFYQLQDDYIPMMAKYNANFPLYKINLIGKTTSSKLEKIHKGGGG